MKVMRAIRVHEFGGPEVLKVENDVPVPNVGNNQVLIRVKASGVNPVDTYIRNGTAMKPALPYTPGMDSAGVVEEVGSGVTNFKKGDRVFTIQTVSGALAEYTLADKQYVAPLPDSLTFEQGASIGIPYYSAYRAIVAKGNLKAGETVLIHGASGAVGIASVQLCKSLGATVIGTAGSKEGADLVTSLGASHVFNHKEDGYDKKIMKATGGSGPDLIIEVIANVNLHRDMEMIKKRGRIVVVGSRGDIEVSPRFLIVKECVVTGILIFESNKEDWVEMHAAIQKGMAAGWLRPQVAKTYPLEKTSAAHYDVIHQAYALGKLVVAL